MIALQLCFPTSVSLQYELFCASEHPRIGQAVIAARSPSSISRALTSSQELVDGVSNSTQLLLPLPALVDHADSLRRHP